jgi:hypothetical protein
MPSCCAECVWQNAIEVARHLFFFFVSNEALKSNTVVLLRIWCIWKKELLVVVVLLVEKLTNRMVYCWC